MTGQGARHLTPRAEAILAAAVIVLAGLFRLAQCRDGLPYLHDWDEPPTASRALRMMQTGDFNPHFFHYGTLMTYLNLLVDIAHYMYLMARPADAPGGLGGLDDIRTVFDTGWLWTISHPSFYFWNRALTALMGAATVAIAWALARRLAGAWAGLAAAAVLAGADFHITQSARVLPNVPVGFFVMLAVWLAVRHLETHDAWSLVGSLASCGAAISTKYNAALCLLVPAVALAASSRNRPVAAGRLWAAVLLVPPLVFVLGTPYALFDLPAFLKGVGYQVREYNVVGHGPATVEPGSAHALDQAVALAEGIGPGAAGLALVGIAGLAASVRGGLVLLFPVTYFLFMSGTRVSFHRNFIPVYSFAAVAAGCGTVWVWRLAVRRAASRQGSRRAGWPAAAAVLLAVPAFIPLIKATGGAVTASLTRETRSMAVDRINALADGTDVRVGVASELRLHRNDLDRLRPQPVVAPLLELLCRQEAGRLGWIVTPAGYDVEQSRSLAHARALNAVLATLGRPREEVPGRDQVQLDRIFFNPRILLFDEAPPEALECGARIPGSRLEPSGRLELEDSGTVHLPPGRTLTTPAFLAAPGLWALSIEASTGRPTSQGLPLGATVLDRAGAGGSGSEQVIVVRDEERPYLAVFDVPAATVLQVRLRIVEDDYFQSLGGGRTVRVAATRMIRLPGEARAALSRTGP
ncbi:MAG TPA: glycosyltransferase family 39 protein [Candidatus Polarisedimenticolia bacterium]|nr:glycosyltransferase family 39 protein [Candidatus Polarisedimenticolia bacterium]